jgi:antitoxin (DNA-binding transcriptional repressor) of toxin-antitoxin stability system
MSTTINIHDLPERLDEVRRMGGDDEITVTDGTTPIARLVPLAARSTSSRSRLNDPFAGEFTDEDVRLARQLLASNPRCFTTEQVKAILRAFDKP